MPKDGVMTTPRRRRSDGERSREAILDGATRLATVEGLDGLSIGRLADHIGMSKSGLYAHFGSKRELQLATIEAADAIFRREVLEPALAAPEGLARVRAFCEEFLAHLQRRVFPGGCFFAAAAAELDTREGPVKDRIRTFYVEFIETFTDVIAQAQQRDEVDPARDPAQLAFELDGLLLGANAGWVLFEDPVVLQRARHAIAERLETAAPRPTRARRR